MWKKNNGSTQTFLQSYSDKRNRSGLTAGTSHLVPVGYEDRFSTAPADGLRSIESSPSFSAANFNTGPITSSPSTGKLSLLGRAGTGTQKEFRTEVEDDAGEHRLRMPFQVEKLRAMSRSTLSASLHEGAAVPRGTLAWVESDTFQFISALVIFGNSIVIGLETDMADFWAWFYVEQSLLIFFVFELVMRLCRNGIMYFKHEDDWVWNLLDFGIVASGVIDQWGMPIIEAYSGKKGHHVGVVFMLMRMLRLLRIVRLFRLVKVIRPLFQLAQGVLEALQGMFWVLVMMIMTLYAAAILCTRFIGHGAALPDDIVDEPDLKPIRKMFSTVPESMFSLFGTMTSWSLLKFVPLFKPFPVLQPMFVLFYIYSAWALLAVMTGVVSENLIAIRDQMVLENEAKEEKRKQNITSTLFDLFAKADADGSGSVSRVEFYDMLRDPMLTKLISKNSNMKVQDLYDLFDWLDHDGGGTITIDEFMVGFKWVNDPLSAKSIVKLQERLISDVNQMKDCSIDEINKRFDQVMEISSHPIKKVHAISEQMDNLDDMCTNLKLGLKEARENLPTMRELSAMELNLHTKLDRAFDRINRVYQAVNTVTSEA